MMTRIPDFSTVALGAAPVGDDDSGRDGSGKASDETTPTGDEHRADAWLTPEGIPVKPAYGPEDRAGLDFLDTYPGLPPYLRGPYPTMYVNQPWTVRQYAGFSTAEDSNAFYRR